MKLLLFYLTDDKRHYTFPHFVELISKSALKAEWKLMVLTHCNNTEFYRSFLKDKSIQYDVINVPLHGNYLTKVRMAANYAETNDIPYVMKCDNDVFLHSATLDYIIENLGILEEKGNEFLTLGPILSSGVPSVELFVERFLSEDQKGALEKMYLDTLMYDRDGATYTHLNKHTLDASVWNSEAFFKDVKNMDHHYKGVHPVRFNCEANQYLNDCILDKKKGFFEQKPSGLIFDRTSPYLCDTLFCIKTGIYKKIVNDESLIVDSFDEVPLNKYAWKNGLGHIFVNNSYAIHITYNWNDGIMEYERDFCVDLFGGRSGGGARLKNTRDVDSSAKMYDRYINYVKDIVKRKDLSSFKSNGAYRDILEHVGDALGNQYLKCIREKTTFSTEDIAVFCAINDAHGGPMKSNFILGKDGRTMRTSPSNFRYILQAYLILKHFQKVNGGNLRTIVEIGGGYGGLALAISYFSKYFDVKIDTYNIIDLEDITGLQSLYLENQSLKFNVQYHSSDTYGAEVEAEAGAFLISNYCFSEIDKVHQEKYIKTLFPKVKHGFMVWNHIPLYDFGIGELEVEEEYPQTDLINRANKYVRF